MNKKQFIPIFFILFWIIGAIIILSTLFGPLYTDALGLSPEDQFCQQKGYSHGYYFKHSNEVACYDKAVRQVCFDKEKTLCKTVDSTKIEHFPPEAEK